MKTVQLKTNNKGFTLIELLVVITIIAALAVTVFVALNPSQRLSNARDARRTSDVDTILTALHEYIVDNKGSYPPGLSAGMPEVQLGTSTSGCALAVGACSTGGAACVDIGTSSAKYLKSVPIDPLGTPTYTSAKTGYDVQIDTNGLVTVKACATEGSSSIQSSR